MNVRQHCIALGAILATQLGMTPPAMAAAISVSIPASMTNSVNGNPHDCGNVIRPALGTSQPFAKRSKMSALLGGRVSKLELIRRQQSGEPSIDEANPDYHDSAEAANGMGYSHGVDRTPPNCLNFAVARLATAPGIQDRLPNSPGPDDFLASKRLPVSRTQFDTSWNRVSRESFSKVGTLNFLRFPQGRVSLATLAAVNSWANFRVRYVEDKDLYGRPDYWATAGETLRRGAGDCEDIAIVKMQLLAAMGVPRSSMYLTITRDLARNADHAILVVKLEGEHWLLDNSTNQLLDAKLGNDYWPIFSFNNRQKFLHGS